MHPFPAFLVTATTIAAMTRCTNGADAGGLLRRSAQEILVCGARLACPRDGRSPSSPWQDWGRASSRGEGRYVGGMHHSWIEGTVCVLARSVMVGVSDVLTVCFAMSARFGRASHDRGTYRTIRHFFCLFVFFVYGC